MANAKEVETFEVSLVLTEPLLGTVPKDKEVYARFIASKAPVAENAESEVETVEEVEIKGWTGFHTDEDGPFLYDYQIKGYFKEVGNTLKDIIGIKALKSKLGNHLFVIPRKIRLPEIMPEPLERPLRAMTMQGPRVSLTRSDQVAAGAVITFKVMMLPHKDIKKPAELLHSLLEYGRLQGIGQWRNGGYGRFEATLDKAA